MSQAYTLSIARVLALFPQVVDAVMRRSDLHLPARQSPTIASYVRAADKKRQSTTQNWPDKSRGLVFTEPDWAKSRQCRRTRWIKL